MKRVVRRIRRMKPNMKRLAAAWRLSLGRTYPAMRRLLARVLAWRRADPASAAQMLGPVIRDAELDGSPGVTARDAGGGWTTYTCTQAGEPVAERN